MRLLQVNFKSENLRTWKNMPLFERCDKNTDTKIKHTKNQKNRILSNKDHQRMMVDPMLSNVLDLRLFLTAVTKTAVIS